MGSNQTDAVDKALLETNLSVNRIAEASGKRYSTVSRRAKKLGVARTSHKPRKLTTEDHQMLNFIRQQFDKPEKDFATDRELRNLFGARGTGSISECPLSDTSTTDQIGDALGWK